ncbi:MAG: hypothetical protein BJ554DRAFT_3191 [Olpidium bornovanus]|uniref:Uncharacterized protein n=1 Tax=Olpidium bornovanus TaxID=278681 RepID=A0A8H7ZNU3_9FUNG|nr:MAG: hypothetical protein BJ554DRAFT_3191 [Olpidium bornovanus]
MIGLGCIKEAAIYRILLPPFGIPVPNPPNVNHQYDVQCKEPVKTGQRHAGGALTYFDRIPGHAKIAKSRSI